MSGWTAEDMPSQEGRAWVVTGANSGLGLETARALAAKGAHVVMACRDAGRGAAAVETVRGQVRGARVELRTLDLASLSSVERFAAELAAARPALDGLVNNAGVMALPRRTTPDGFEMQLGTNHLGHFALTLRLWPLLDAAPAARVVTVASHTHHLGAVDFDDLHGERGYSAWGAYGRSKLANLLFAYELQRRVAAAGRPLLSLAAHPGYTATNLLDVAPKMQGRRLLAKGVALANALVAQSVEMGALPQLYAATAPDVEGGAYYGPDGLFALFGYPTRVDSNRRSKDPALAARLWEASEALTGLRWGLQLAAAGEARGVEGAGEGAGEHALR